MPSRLEYHQLTGCIRKEFFCDVLRNNFNFAHQKVHHNNFSLDKRQDKENVALHDFLLQEKTFGQYYTVDKAYAQKKIYITDNFLNKIIDIKNSLQSSTLYQQLMSFVEYTDLHIDIMCKDLRLITRVDYYGNTNNGPFLVDIKTTNKGISKSAFQNNIKAFFYYNQLAFDVFCLQKQLNTDVIPNCYTILISLLHPYTNQIFKMSNQQLIKSFLRNKKILAYYSKMYAQNSQGIEQVMEL